MKVEFLSNVIAQGATPKKGSERVFTTYLKGQLQQHNTTADEAIYEWSKFISVAKNRVPGRTCIDALRARGICRRCSSLQSAAGRHISTQIGSIPGASTIKVTIRNYFFVHLNCLCSYPESQRS